MKYEGIASPFYCTVLQRAFTKGSIVEIENTKRGDELVNAGLLAVVDVKKKSTTRKKVKQDV
ncbi:MAG: hypothetical protein ACRDDM_08040 [Paraclostridium sp.]